MSSNDGMPGYSDEQKQTIGYMFGGTFKDEKGRNDTEVSLHRKVAYVFEFFLKAYYPQKSNDQFIWVIDVEGWSAFESHLPPKTLGKFVLIDDNEFEDVGAVMRNYFDLECVHCRYGGGDAGGWRRCAVQPDGSILGVLRRMEIVDALESLGCGIYQVKRNHSQKQKAKHEMGSDGHGALNIGIRRTQNDCWEVNKAIINSLEHRDDAEMVLEAPLFGSPCFLYPPSPSRRCSSSPHFPQLLLCIGICSSVGSSNSIESWLIQYGISLPSRGRGKLKSRKPMTPVVSKVKKVKIKATRMYLMPSIDALYFVNFLEQIRRWKEGKRHTASQSNEEAKFLRLKQNSLCSSLIVARETALVIKTYFIS
ncbi:hypothetical protein SASPL_157173 [Salvia splendens]|uniref:Uncharacterized protein n=1 Tax=Salvia splendens TaxID=180675 RepID=A0A8X8VVB1_SALSN|nr:hypothetical protein SASPL_157173 [Salvia splendens]